VEIDEYIYNPEKNVRVAIVKLMHGQVRALVSKVFTANGSKFEIHTPSAVAAARGTYFTVWVENGQSGIINIGEKGRVDFTSGGMTVAVDPGFFSVAQEGQAPASPQPHQFGLTGHDQQVASAPFLAGLTRALVAVELTTLREAPLRQSPAQTAKALNLAPRKEALTKQHAESPGEELGHMIHGHGSDNSEGDLGQGSPGVGINPPAVLPGPLRGLIP